MRKFALLAIFCLVPLAVQATPSEEDRLFAQLKAAESAEIAKPIEDKLSELFRVSGSPSVDLLMSRAGAALSQTDNGTARALVDAVTRGAPRYAEGWRMKAHMQQAGGDDSGAMISLRAPSAARVVCRAAICLASTPSAAQMATLRPLMLTAG